jgi:hypothetical protein
MVWVVARLKKFDFGRCCELRTMQSRTAQSDLFERTLSRIASAVGRIAYFTDLKETGEYRHWGLERLHGKAETEAALSTAHTNCMLDLLRRRFPEQISDAVDEARRLDVRAEDLLKRLHAARTNAAPKEWSGASPEHLEWNLFVLANWQFAELQNGPAA